MPSGCSPVTVRALEVQLPYAPSKRRGAAHNPRPIARAARCHRLRNRPARNGAIGTTLLPGARGGKPSAIQPLGGLAITGKALPDNGVLCPERGTVRAPDLVPAPGRRGATTFQQDRANADCILIQGSNMAECHPVGFQWVMEAKARGATVIHVDPRFTRASAVADRHGPIRGRSRHRVPSPGLRAADGQFRTGPDRRVRLLRRLDSAHGRGCSTSAPRRSCRRCWATSAG